MGQDANVDLEALSRFARDWERALGVAIEVSPATPTAASSTAGQPFVAVIDDLPEATAAHRVVVDFDGATANLDQGPDLPARIGGRGIEGCRWAIRHLVSRYRWPAATYRYGPAAEQVADLRLPTGEGPHPLVVLIHGGGWKHRWQRDLMAPIAVDLAEHGIASWNIEFRRVGGGGGWPTTFDDLRAAIDALPTVEEADRVDFGSIYFLGHSSGGHLALWAAKHGETQLQPALVIAIAAVTDLAEASRRQLIGGENIAARLLGGTPDEVPERYAAASPIARLPLGTPQLLVQGLSDYIPDLIDLNRCYARAARAAGDSVELVELAEADHLGPIEPTTGAWQQIRGRLESALVTSTA